MRKNALWGIAGTALFLVGAFLFLNWEWSQPTENATEKKVEPAKKEDKSAKARQGTAENPVVVRVLADADKKKETDENKGKRGHYSPEWNLVYLTIFLTAFTFGLMIFTAMLWFSTQALVIGAENVSKKELRAYMAMEHIWFSIEEKQLMLGQIAKQMIKPLNIRIRNYGKTPAFEVSIWCDGNTERPMSFASRSPGAGKQMLHPNNHFSIAVSQPEMPDPYKSPHGEGGWIWGHLVYRDAFDGWWRTNFFWRYHPPKDGKGDGLFSPESEYNGETGPYKDEKEALGTTSLA